MPQAFLLRHFRPAYRAIRKERSEGEETSADGLQVSQTNPSLTVVPSGLTAISTPFNATVTRGTTGPRFDASRSHYNALEGSSGVSVAADECDRPGGIGDAEGDT